MDRARSLLVAMAFVTVAVAGCVSTHEGPKEFTVPRDAGPEAKQDGVPDPYELNVRVVSADDGTPIRGAAVVFFETVTRQSGTVFYYVTASEYEALAAARTDADGRVIGHLAPNTTVNVGVGDVAGRTNEIRPQVVLGGPDDSGTLEVALYRDQVAVIDAADLGLRATNPASQVGLAEPERVVVPVRFSADDVVGEGYRERLVGLTLTIRWNNTFTSYADLFAGVRSADGSVEWWGDDARQGPGEDGLAESVTVDESGLAGGRASFAGAGLEAEALTDEPVVTMDGIPVRFEIVGTFHASDLVIHS